MFSAQARVVVLTSFGLVVFQEAFTARAGARESLVGAWRLVSVEADSGGRIAHPLGGSPKGFLVLTQDGYWSAQLMAESHGAAGRDPIETYRAHFGTYEVDEGAKKLVLHRDGDLDSSGVGTDTLRFFELEGSRVVMTLPTERRGDVDVTTRVVWERVGETHGATR